MLQENLQDIKFLSSEILNHEFYQICTCKIIINVKQNNPPLFYIFKCVETV